ncbi:phage shock protein operon transcriptional activator [Hyphococcus sp.]|uniref:phage shock protein operon transcriptional activator n=1 Tax=Hyphococcus sp. TaxID=2038636 RepID=UPI003CCC05EB
MRSHPQPPDLIGQSKIFLDALDHASRVAPVNRPVLVVGERGAGKELFAARIHFLSSRWDGPFIKVNCAAMSEELLESELFGHEAGAFTGATKRHKGRFERAQGGSLFLDEIASASLRVQEKLLRVIEYGEYERIGGEETRQADVRVIAAANVDLRNAARQGKFRADLLDRLAFDVVFAPPLRQRPEDISLLAAYFAQGVASELGVEFPGFSPSGIAQLRAYHWPGNVRELKNAAERAIYFWADSGSKAPIDQIIIDPFEAAFGAIDETKNTDVDEPAGSTNTTNWSEKVSDLRAYLYAIEKEIAGEVLQKYAGNQTKAAKALSLTYDQMRGIIKKHNLQTD